MAISTLKVKGSMGQGFRTEIEASHKFVIDQPKTMGGQDEGCNPMEIFLSSLPACICAIGRIVANQKRIKLDGITAEVEGDIDKDFLLGVTEEGRAGFIEIRAFVDVQADLTKEEKEAFIREVERRCPIADNICQNSIIKTMVN
jgi:uncharacterized OsmC-like protein